MTEHNLLEHIGLPATSYKEDARLWQWFSNGVDDGRLECSRKDDVWNIGSPVATWRAIDRLTTPSNLTIPDRSDLSEDSNVFTSNSGLPAAPDLRT